MNPTPAPPLMSLSPQHPSMVTAPGSRRSEDARVLDALAQWQREGVPTALVTLAGIEGPAPRPLGAHMAVAADGRSVGYPSGGCLEAAIVEEARGVIATKSCRVVRYGRGSPYFDIRLACGGGLDIHVNAAFEPNVLREAHARSLARQPFALHTNLASGQSRIADLKPAHPPPTTCDGSHLARSYLPAPRLVLAGAGPVVPRVAVLFAAAELDVLVLSPEPATRNAVATLGHPPFPLTGDTDFLACAIDRWTAVVLMFHDHAGEPALLSQVLTTPAFYIGAMGNRAAHSQRLELLGKSGVREADLGRVRGSIGSLAGAKSATTLASGILTEVLAAAKALGYIA